LLIEGEPSEAPIALKPWACERDDVVVKDEVRVLAVGRLGRIVQREAYDAESLMRIVLRRNAIESNESVLLAPPKQQWQ
jgi:hypothetical protein